MISLESYPFWRYGSSVGVVGVGNILFCWFEYIYIYIYIYIYTYEDSKISSSV